VEDGGGSFEDVRRRLRHRCRLGDRPCLLAVVFVFWAVVVVFVFVLVCVLSFLTSRPHFGAVDFNGGPLSTW
jgi:hypothetical protein